MYDIIDILIFAHLRRAISIGTYSTLCILIHVQKFDVLATLRLAVPAGWHWQLPVAFLSIMQALFSVMSEPNA